ncbi:hypothetical protein ACFLS1_13000 [Verrucomicrobiota bacterium]
MSIYAFFALGGWIVLIAPFKRGIFRINTLIFLTLLLAAGIALAENVREIDLLIQKLGATSHKERQDASAALRQIGQPAREALERAAKSGDPEIQIRARDILQDIKYGINPSWPEELCLKIRGYEQLDSSAKKQLIHHLFTDYGKQAIPFLLDRVEKGANDDAALAVDRLKDMPDQDAVWKQIVEQVKKPVNKYETRLLVYACERSNDLSNIAHTFGCEHLENNGKTKLTNLAVTILREQLGRRKYKEAEKHADTLAQVAANEARFLYLRAIALSALDRKSEAETIGEKALSLNPDSEGSHYTAGEMLLDLGQLRLSEKEWKKILEIPPVDDVYDINAYMRLGSIYAKCEMYTKAADALETGLAKYEKAKATHSSGMGMIGGNTLKERIASLREKAHETDGEKNRRIQDSAADELTITITTSLKDADPDDLVKELRTVTASTTMRVQPHGLRLFEKTNAILKYDSRKDEIAILLNGSPCTKPTKFVCKQETEKFALNNLDMCYIFKVYRDTGAAEKIKSFERDYTVTITRGPAISAWKNTVITVNDKAYTWKKLAEGVPFDFLPEKLKVKIKGLTPAGEEKTINKILDPEELMHGQDKKNKPTAVKIRIDIGI